MKTVTQEESEKCCLQQRAAGQTVPLKIRESASQDHHAYQPGQVGWYSILENESLRPADWEGVGVALLSNSVTFCGTHFLNKHDGEPTSDQEVKIDPLWIIRLMRYTFL